MKSFCFALQHLTRITLYKGQFDEVAFGRASLFFPAVGLLLGLILWSAIILMNHFYAAPLVAALMVVVTVIVTGGMHLDGFMDTVDGVFSGRPRERKLEIMRDSRIGAFGALGLVCLVLLKYNIFLTLPPALLFKAIILAMLLSRWSMVYAIACFPYARKEGLGTLYKKYTGKRELLWATGTTALVAGIVAGMAGVLLLLITWGWVYVWGSKMTAELGGLTGDIYGATAEISELVIYLITLAVYNQLPLLFTTFFIL